MITVRNVSGEDEGQRGRFCSVQYEYQSKKVFWGNSVVGSLKPFITHFLGRMEIKEKILPVINISRKSAVPLA